MAISLVKLILFGVPEITLIFMTGLVLYRSSVKQNIPLFIVKLMIANILMLSVIYFVRRFFTNTVSISFVNTLVSIIIFRFLWEMNWRQSILAAITGMFIVMFIETTTLPLYEKVRHLYGNEDFFSVGLRFSLIYRAIHLLIFFIFTKYHLRGSSILEVKWSQLPAFKKVILSTIIASVGMCFFISANYYDMHVRMASSDVDLSGFSLNFTFFYWGNIFVFMVFVLLLFIIYFLEKQFQQAKAFLDIPPEDLMDIIGDDSDEQEINGYITILQKKLEVKEDVTQ